MNGRELVLLIDDDAQIRDGLTLLLERAGRTTVVCSDIESAEFVLAHYDVTHVLTDVQFSGTFGFEGLHFIARIRALRPGCRIVLMTGYATPALRAAAIELGATVCLQKPFDAEQLDAALRSPGSEDGGYVVVPCPPIDKVIADDVLSTVYQPIVRLRNGRRVFAFEALARPGGAWANACPSELFAYAERRERLADLNVAALTNAIHAAARLPEEALLFLNVDPATFERSGIATALRIAAERADIPLSRLVLEITERSGFPTDRAAFAIVDELRELGIRFALDDHGSAYSHLGAIDVIRPAFFKISATFGTGFEKSDAKTRIVRHIVALSHDFGCRTVIEGVETAETADAAAAMGIELAQGFHFGRPGGAESWTEPRRLTQRSGASGIRKSVEASEDARRLNC